MGNQPLSGDSSTAPVEDLREAPEKFFSAHSLLSEYATKAKKFDDFNCDLEVLERDEKGINSKQGEILKHKSKKLSNDFGIFWECESRRSDIVEVGPGFGIRFTVYSLAATVLPF